MTIAFMDAPTGDSYVRQIRKRLRLSQNDFAKRLGLELKTYKHYEYGVNAPPEVVRAAERLEGRPRGTTGSDALARLRAIRPGKLRLLGTVGAGEADVWHIDDVGNIPIPIQFERDDFGGLIVHDRGYSLLPYVQPGDLAIIKHTPIHKVGKIGAVAEEDGLLILKNVEIDHGAIVLRSTNPKFPDIREGEHQYKGVLVGIMSADGALILGPYEDGIGVDDLKRIFGGRIA